MTDITDKIKTQLFNSTIKDYEGDVTPYLHKGKVELAIEKLEYYYLTSENEALKWGLEWKNKYESLEKDYNKLKETTS